jgi:hypothetical protein
MIQQGLFGETNKAIPDYGTAVAIVLSTIRRRIVAVPTGIGP